MTGAVRQPTLSAGAVHRPTTVRLWTGTGHADDTWADLAQALEKVDA